MKSLVISSILALNSIVLASEVCLLDCRTESGGTICVGQVDRFNQYPIIMNYVSVAPYPNHTVYASILKNNSFESDSEMIQLGTSGKSQIFLFNEVHFFLTITKSDMSGTITQKVNESGNAFSKEYTESISCIMN